MNRVLHGEGALRLFFVAQGHVEIGAGKSRFALGPGEAFLAEPARRSIMDLSYETDADFYVIQFRRSPQPVEVARRTLEVPEHVATRNPGRLTHLLRMFMEEAHRAAPSSLVFHHLVVLMLCEMASSSRVSGAPRVRDVGPESLASHVDAYIAAHYHEQIRTRGLRLRCATIPTTWSAPTTPSADAPSGRPSTNAGSGRRARSSSCSARVPSPRLPPSAASRTPRTSAASSSRPPA